MTPRVPAALTYEDLSLRLVPLKHHQVVLDAQGKRTGSLTSNESFITKLQHLVIINSDGIVYLKCYVCRCHQNVIVLDAYHL